MADAFADAAAAIKVAFDAEFAPEGVALQYDDLHESLGRDSIEAGISPMEEAPLQNDRLVQSTLIKLQFYDLWPDTSVDPAVQVDPRRITGFAARFREAVKAANTGRSGTGLLWFFDVDSVSYPRDPTGNKTRFVAVIRCQGNNNNLIETV